ncbi:RecQ family ATP-dependent DNA helicase [Xylanibacter brevis]|uniref:RecQ family ATP-dependent DNA helicase n=1 Tax=Xylanibacter brevis TaxID=83231 RepID=UPI000484DCED|nr:ATP-dependent DNA helicase RecQ [Xylanibacter brevis]
MDYEQILKKYWGYDDFRGIQKEIIESIGSQKDTLGLMPTGGGKSITFQVPALAQEGTCIVITPLIALMKDQVQNLRKRGIRAAAIHSDLSHDDVIKTLENAVFGAIKLLYVSPERLSSELFLQKLNHMKVSFICIDEAHCICQWGYDFRPSYLAIGNIRKMLPDTPILALTATATPAVVDDIQEKLLFKQKNVFRMSFERKNLAYVVRETADKEAQLIHILKRISGSAIVYARSRQRTKETAELLCKNGLDATFFHAGLDYNEKDQRQKEWQEGKVRIIVATNAFGMGIDKPDVRVVIHIDCPDSLEAYFQEAGRAGRDGKKAYAVLLYNDSDAMKLHKRIVDTFPEKDYIRKVYDHLAYFYQIGIGSGYNAMFEFPIDKFCHNFKHFPIRVDAALKILDRAGYIEYHEEEECKARVRFVLERDDLYRLRGNSKEEDALIITLLRNYSGLFNGFQYIDETFLAQQTDSTTPMVYLLLKGLAQKNIIQFIPQKKTPLIRYRQRREESQYLSFPPAVYETLKERFSERIEHMINYATRGNQCRSQQLLRYFGETKSKPCGQCDVCLSHGNKAGFKVETKTATEAIKNILADKKPHEVKELMQLPFDSEAIQNALRKMTLDEAITIEGTTVRLDC